MKEFVVTLSETQNYSIKVKAKNEEEAKEIAEETYGMDGEISGTYVEIGECYEAKK